VIKTLASLMIFFSQRVLFYRISQYMYSKGSFFPFNTTSVSKHSLCSTKHCSVSVSLVGKSTVCIAYLLCASVLACCMYNPTVCQYYLQIQCVLTHGTVLDCVCTGCTGCTHTTKTSICSRV